MLQVDAKAFHQSSLALDRMRTALQRSFAPGKKFRGPADSDRFLPAMQTDMRELREVFVALGVRLSLKSLDRLITLLGDENCTCEAVAKEMEEIESRIRDELGDVSLWAINSSRTVYVGQAKLFGDEVFYAFPSASNDILEAGNCLALERGTAAVMHLMRVCEVGLKTLAAAIGVDSQGDWGSYLREIDDALEAKRKKSGKRTPDEQFYAEAKVTLDNVRMAWRNATMHIENTYSAERAEEILISVRGLMRHLSTKLSELPWARLS